MFSFNLRKDVSSRLSTSQLENLQRASMITNLNTYKNTIRQSIGRKYVNTLLNSDINIGSTVEKIDDEKISVSRLPSELQTIFMTNNDVKQTLTTHIIDNYVETVITKQVTSIVDTTVNDILNVQFDNKVIEVVETRIGEKIGTLDIKTNDLIKKIDYLFEMLYHSNPETLMVNYPLKV